jgi:23S rRNA pseudouridine2605 synthase
MEKVKPERIAKLLARAGVASRRDIERMIEAGRVRLNGAPVTHPATLLTSVVGLSVDGKPVEEPEAARLFCFHKPQGCVTSARDPRGRRTVFDVLPLGLPRVISVGRLDLNTEGLLLLTTDGELARHLELPASGYLRRYRVRVHGPVDDGKLKSLRDGVTIDGIRYGAIDAERDPGPAVGLSNSWLRIAIREGKNREVRRVCEHIGLKVTRLIRVAYGPFDLGDLPVGQVREVPAAQIAGLMAAGTHAHHRG